MLGHAGTATPAWREVIELGEELQRLGELTTARVAADCAILFSWPNWWAVEQIGQPSAELRMLEQVRWMYRPLFEAGVTADFAAPGEDLSGYPVVLVPSLYLLTEAEGASLRRYVENGGTAVISFWSGIVDEHDRVHLGPYGGPLRELIGGDVVDVAPLQPDQSVEVAWADGRRSAGPLSSGTSRSFGTVSFGTVSFGTLWQDVIEARRRRGAGPLRRRPLGGLPGRAQQAGRRRADDLRRDAAGHRRAGRPARPGARRALDRQRGSAAAGVERVVRRTAGASYEFLINHRARAVSVPLAAAGQDLLSGAAVSGQLELPPQGVAIVRRES